MESSKSEINSMYILPVVCFAIFISHYLFLVYPTIYGESSVAIFYKDVIFKAFEPARIIFLLGMIVVYLLSPVSDVVSETNDNGAKDKIKMLVLFILSGLGIFFVDHFNKMLYTLLWPVCLFVYLFTGYVLKDLFRKKDYKLKKEFGFQYNPVKTNGKWDFVWFSKEWGYMNIEQFQRHKWILGGPGAGKTSRLINKIISDSIKKGFALLIFDFKMNANLEKDPRKWALTRYAFGVMRLYSKRAHRDLNGKWIGEHSIDNDRRNFWIINFRDPRYSHRINPFLPTYIESEAFAHEYAATLLQNMNPKWVKDKDFFAEASIAYYKPIIWFTKKISEMSSVSVFSKSKVLGNLNNHISESKSNLEYLESQLKEYQKLGNLSAAQTCKTEISIIKTHIKQQEQLEDQFKSQAEYCTIPHSIAIACQDANKVLAALSLVPECALMVESLKKAIVEKAGGQIAGVIATIQNLLMQLRDPRLTWVLSANSPGLNLRINDPENPAVLSFGSDPELKGVFSPIAALIGKIASKVMNQPGRLPSENIYDEMPQICINNLQDTLATCRSNDMGFTICGQDDSQYQLIYTKEQADALMANCGNVIIGQVNHPDTAKKYSEYIGQREKEQKGYNTGSNTGESLSRSKGQNISFVDKHLIAPHELSTLATGEFVGKYAHVNEDTPYDFWFRTKLPVFTEPIEDIPFPQIYLKENGQEFSLEEMEILMQSHNEALTNEVRDFIDTCARYACEIGAYEEKLAFPNHEYNGVKVVSTWGIFLYEGMSNYNRVLGTYDGIPNIRKGPLFQHGTSELAEDSTKGGKK